MILSALREYQIFVMPAWIAGIQVCKDASGDIHVKLDSSTPCWNDAIVGCAKLTEVLLQDRLEPFIVHLQFGFKGFDLAVVSRVKNFSVGEPQIFSYDVVNKFLVAVNDFARLRHGSEKLRHNRLVFGNKRPASEEDRDCVGKMEIGSIDDVMQPARQGLRVRRRVH